MVLDACLPFDASFWMWGCGAVLFVSPLVALGWKGFVQASGVVGLGVRESGSSLGSVGLADVSAFVSPLRGLWSLGNWV